MSFASHKEVSTPACPIHMWSDIARKPRVRKVLRVATWGAATAGILTGLAALKCILIYIVVPTLAVRYFLGQSDLMISKEISDAREVSPAPIVDHGEPSSVTHDSIEDRHPDPAR